ncbi:hypothetical protein MMC25_007853 [Agyrium rufum]|nr:hypothetical protein [Agyrium rufum]
MAEPYTDELDLPTLDEIFQSRESLLANSYPWTFENDLDWNKIFRENQTLAGDNPNDSSRSPIRFRGVDGVTINVVQDPDEIPAKDDSSDSCPIAVRDRVEIDLTHDDTENNKCELSPQIASKERSIRKCPLDFGKTSTLRDGARVRHPRKSPHYFDYSVAVATTIAEVFGDREHQRSMNKPGSNDKRKNRKSSKARGRCVKKPVGVQKAQCVLVFGKGPNGEPTLHRRD